MNNLKRENKWKLGPISWEQKDSLYISVPFTWLVKKTIRKIKASLGSFFPPKKIIVGGPGAVLARQKFEGLANVEEDAPRGVSPLNLYNPNATFTTRGCPNSCGFCAVPRLEGDIKEIIKFKPAPIICDNNLLAASKKHIWKVIDSCKRFNLVDFNQGLDACRFTKTIASKFAEIKCILRFAFDSIKEEDQVINAIKIAIRAGWKARDIRVYVLFGYKDTLEETLYRLELLRKFGVLPFPMRYRPLNIEKLGEYIPKGWDRRVITPWLGFILQPGLFLEIALLSKNT